MKKLIRSKPFLIAGICVLMGIFAYLSEIPFLDLMELKTIDLRFESRGKISPRPEVVLAAIDEKSLAKEGKWIWPRSKLADLVDALSAAGAKVIAFDIGFLEPDDRRTVQIVEKIKQAVQDFEIKNLEIKNYLEKLEIETDNDQRLAHAIRQSRARIVLGYFFQMEQESTRHADEKEFRGHEENIRGSRYGLVRHISGTARSVPMIEAAVPQSNIQLISSATNYSGFFNMYPDRDGVVRGIPAVVKYKEDLYAPLSLAAAGAYLNSPLSVIVAEYGIEGVRVGSITVPTDEFGRMLINYRGKEKTFPHIPVTDILHDAVAQNRLKDKIVLVGATAAGIYDLRVTPVGNLFPGLEIHANILDSVLAKDFLQRPAWAPIFDILAILAAGLFLGIVLPRTGAIAGIASGFSVFIGYILLCGHLFVQNGFILNLVYPLTVVVAIYVGVTAYKYFAETKQKRFIKEAFSTYLAPSVVKQLIESPEKLVLGGEERIITALFSDVQGFTGISEQLKPKELVDIINEFLTEMTDIILRYEGTVDKFEGDAIIAFFGAPNDLENHPEVACRTCIDMQKKLARLRVKWKADGKPELKMRIGLNTGPAVVGNMGSKTRMDYTMMGDTVNTAARLEGANKLYGIYTLISESTCRAVSGKIAAREIDSIQVFGRKAPVKVYELLGYPEDIDGSLAKMADYYSKGLKAYRDQDWDGAVFLFNAALEASPADGPSRTLLARCNAFKLRPPGKDWDGSFSMSSK